MWSAPIVVTPAVDEPVSIADAKTYLRIDGSALDGQVALFVAAARDDIEAMTGTRLLNQTVKLLADCWADLETLPIGPVASVASLKYRDAQGAEQTLDPAIYELTGAGLERGVRPKLGQPFPVALRTLGGGISVSLVVGYVTPADIPPRLRLAIFRLVRGMLDEAPADVADLLVNHRIWL